MKDNRRVTFQKRAVTRTIKDWLFLQIEGKELLFVLLSFCDAVITSLCLDLGGYEAIPWMEGWGADASIRMAVAISIILYLKIRDKTKLIWWGNSILFAVVIWNCIMFLILLLRNVQPLGLLP